MSLRAESLWDPDTKSGGGLILACEWSLLAPGAGVRKSRIFRQLSCVLIVTVCHTLH